MSIKNQRPLFISAAIIIGLTAASLVGLNLVVDHISKLSPPAIAMAEPPRRPKAPIGSDDAIEKMKMPPAMPTEIPRPDMMDPRMKPRIPAPGERAPDDAMRRIRNGKDAPDIKRTQPPTPPSPPSNGRDDAQNGQRAMPGNPPPGYYPPPYPMDPKEREQMEKMMQQGPPPGYYPPPGYFQQPPPYQQEAPYGRDPYDQGYDNPDDFYYDEYEPDYEDYDSKLDLKEHDDERTADVHDTKEGKIDAGANDTLEHQDDYILDEEIDE